jgi:hypothetical protein
VSLEGTNRAAHWTPASIWAAEPETEDFTPKEVTARSVMPGSCQTQRPTRLLGGNRNARQLLEERLRLRNLCGHPTGYTPGREEAVIFIEGLVLNILSGSWLNW